MIWYYDFMLYVMDVEHNYNDLNPKYKTIQMENLP